MYQTAITKQYSKKNIINISPLFGLVRAYRSFLFGNKESGIQKLKELLRVKTHHPMLHVVHQLIEAGVYTETQEYLQDMQCEHPYHAEIKYYLSRCYFSEGNLEQARNLIKQALDIEPGQAKYWSLLADCLLEFGYWREATEALNMALLAEPKKAENFYRLGTVFALNGEKEAALLCFQGCCQLNRHNPAFWEAKGEMHLQLEQMEEACISFEKSWRYGAEPEVLARIAYCNIQMNRINQGIKYYERILKYDPEHYDALCNLAAVFQNQNRSMDALNLLERALEIKPNDAILLNNLAYTHVHLGRTRKAVEYYNEALKIMPKHPMILYNLSVCLTKKGNWEESIATIHNLLEVDPEHSEGWALLGNIYDAISEYPTAVDCYNRSLKLA